MEFEKNEKVIAMYQAVCTLLDEGNDLHKLKVSDITAKAGIGKGTAYEYFRSKEELVAKAVYYDYVMQFYELEQNVRKKQSLREGLECCFTWLCEQQKRPRLAMQLLKRAGGLEGNQEKLFENGAACCKMEAVDRILEYLVKTGKEEGVVHPEIPDELVCLQILSQLLGFFSVVQKFKGETGTGPDHIKDYLYRNLVKSLKTL